MQIHRLSRQSKDSDQKAKHLFLVFHQLLKLSFVKSPLHRGTNNSFQLWPQMRPLRHQIWHLRPQIRPIGHQTENGNWRKLPLCGIVGHWPFRGRCSSHRLILTYTNIGASGTADHATLLQLFFLPLLVPLPRPNEILLGLPTSGAARCPRIKRRTGIYWQAKGRYGRGCRPYTLLTVISILRQFLIGILKQNQISPLYTFMLP